MKRLEDIKGKIVEVPELCKRYVCVTWRKTGWQIINSYQMFTTPEDAMQDLMNYSCMEDVEYYSVVELELKIPVSK